MKSIPGQREASGILGKNQPFVLNLSVLLLAALILMPLFYLLVRTLGAGDKVWELLLRARTVKVMGRTLLLASGVTASCLFISLPLAWLTTRTDLPLRRLWGIMASLPLVMPSYVAGLAVLSALGPRGFFQQALENTFGIKAIPDIYGYPGALITIVIVSYPLMLLTINAAIIGLDPGLEEVSRSLGHGPLQTFFRVTLHRLRPSITAGALLVSLYTLRDFGAVSLFRYETFTWAIYLQYQTSFDRSIAASLSLVLASVAFVILFIEGRIRGGDRYFGGQNPGKAAPTIVLGKFRWPALLFCAFTTVFSLLVPLSVLAYWFVVGLFRGEEFGRVLLPAFNSVSASMLAALSAVVIALPLSFYTARNSGRLKGIVEAAIHTGYALPGIVVALALVFFSTNLLPYVYQSLGLLVLAYVVLFIPQAVGSIRSSILLIDPHLEEAARSLGRKASQTALSITVPLVRPGILAGLYLVFFTAMKELPATLILSPIGFKTLATSVWSATSEAFFARAAMPALLLLGCSSIPLILLTLKERGLKGGSSGVRALNEGLEGGKPY